jgi:hypothetical protein
VRNEKNQRHAGGVAHRRCILDEVKHRSNFKKLRGEIIKMRKSPAYHVDVGVAHQMMSGKKSYHYSYDY